MNKERKILTIVIPTYNRCEEVCKNISLLNDCITKNNLSDRIKIIVSDNHSEDDTYNKLLSLKNQYSIDLECKRQEKNIGGTNNSRSIMRILDTPYALLLGDDDYLDERYLPLVIKYLERRKDISAIIPNFHTNLNNNCRDAIVEDRLYKKGINNIGLMFKAHQMSGLVFKMDGVMETLYERNGENEYYQTFCIGYNILRGTTVHITRFPVCVNTTNKKFWSYGKNGLWDDMFLNIKILELPYKERMMTERYYLLNYSWTYVLRFFKNPIDFVRSINGLKNMTDTTKRIVIPLMFCSVIKIIYKKRIKKEGKYRTNGYSNS